MIFLIVASFAQLGIIIMLGEPSMPSWFGLVITQVVYIGVPCAIYLIIHRKSIRQILPMRKLGVKNIAMIVGMSIALYPLVILLNFVTTLFFGSHLAETMENMQYESGILIMLILFPILPSIFEEVAMRGIIFSGFKKVKIFVAAIINGLFFGALHQNFNQFSYAFVIGFIMCYMMYYTKSIWAPVLCHFVVNIMGILIPYLLTRFVNTDALEETTQVAGQSSYEWQEYLFVFFGLAVFAAIAMGIFIIIYIAYKRHNLKRNNDEGVITNTYMQAVENGEAKPKALTGGFWGAMGLGLGWMLLIQWAMSMM
ncbi:MAG: CPBP family intramembrane metalloprotease [Defluviitaleaceae bacterium]|nr:CPBP family intramembrane metalloprotease [Defluviitaleaceae bacterium]